MNTKFFEKKLLLICLMSILSLALTACVGSVGRQSIKGDYAKVSNDAVKISYDRLSVENHYNVCKSFLSMQRISKLDECMEPLWKRAYREKFSAYGINTYSRDYIDILLNNIEATKYIELGEFDRAYEYASKSFAATQRKPRILLNQGVSMFTSIATLGMNNPNSENSYTGQQTRIAAIVEPYALMAIIESLRDNEQQALKFRTLLQELYMQIDKSSTENLSGNLSLIRRWLGQSYYVAGDYNAAYDIVTRDDRGDLMKLSDAILLSGILAFKKPVLDPVSFAINGSSFDELRFLHEFPLKIMIYRSAFKTGRLDVARKGYDSLLAEERMKSFASLYFHLLHERAQIALAQGKSEAAEIYFKQAIELLEEQRTQLKQESYKLGFVGDKLSVYNELITFLFERERYAEALEYVERSKARALVDMLASKKGFAIESEHLQVEELLTELAHLEAKDGQFSSISSREKRRSIKTDLLGKIKNTSEELGTLVSVTTSSAQEIQAQIRPNEALLEFYYQNDKAYVFVVRKEGIDALILDVKNLNKDIHSFRTAIESYNTNHWKQWSQKLYERLIKPLESLLDEKKHLTIIPHGALHYLPFNALNNHNTGKFLIENYSLRLLPSASVLKFLNKRTAPSRTLLIFGNPDLNNPLLDLPGAEDEAKEIARLWSDSKVIVRKNASESLIKKSAGMFKYLHLAGHGQFNPDEPLKSRMLLAPDNNNDGNLTVPEIYKLKLNADMVVLSACQTALGEIKNGDDVIGLNRAFLYSGAKSIVGSLWEVPDNSTRDLMLSLYKNLKSMELRTAMQKAQLSVLRKYKHPIYWAAFQITGGI